jgi:hypothetical protein
MCHHHTPIELIAEREADADADEDEAEPTPEIPRLTPPADD